MIVKVEVDAVHVAMLLRVHYLEKVIPHTTLIQLDGIARGDSDGGGLVIFEAICEPPVPLYLVNIQEFHPAILLWAFCLAEVAVAILVELNYWSTALELHRVGDGCH